MSVPYEDSVIDFDLDFLHQSSNKPSIFDKPDLSERTRKSVLVVKKKIIATDSLIRKYYEKKEEVDQIEKSLQLSKDECKQTCIDFRNLSEKYNHREKEAEILRNSNLELKQTCHRAESLFGALQSHANQLQVLVKENETTIESLNKENQLQKANVKENEKKVTSLQKEKIVLMKHLSLMRDIIFGKKKLNERRKSILKQYEKSDVSDDDDSVFGDDSGDEINDITTVRSSHENMKGRRVAAKDDVEHDSDCSNEHASADTGRGSSLAFSDGEKCFNSPDYFLIHSPMNTENEKSKCIYVNASTSPIPFKRTTDIGTSPIPEYENIRIELSPINTEKREEMTNLTNPFTDDIEACHIEESLFEPEDELMNTVDSILNKNSISDILSSPTALFQENTLNSIDFSEPIEIVSINIPQSPSRVVNSNQRNIHENSGSGPLTEKECLEMNSSNNNDVNTKRDCELEMIFNNMRFDRTLITPIPSTPSKSCDLISKVTLQDGAVCNEAAKIREENKILYENIAKLVEEVKSIKNILKNNQLIETNINIDNESMSHCHLNDSVDLATVATVSSSTQTTKPPPTVVLNPNVRQEFTDETIEKSVEVEARENLPLSRFSNRLETEDSEWLVDDTLDNRMSEKPINTGKTTDNEENILQKKERRTRMKHRKISKLEKMRNKLVPRCKIKTSLVQSKGSFHRKITQPVVFKRDVTENDTSATLNNKLVYEKAIKIMSELKLHENSTLSTREVLKTKIKGKKKLIQNIDICNTKATDENNVTDLNISNPQCNEFQKNMLDTPKISHESHVNKIMYSQMQVISDTKCNENMLVQQKNESRDLNSTRNSKEKLDNTEATLRRCKDTSKESPKSESGITLNTCNDSQLTSHTSDTSANGTTPMQNECMHTSVISQITIEKTYPEQQVNNSNPNVIENSNHTETLQKEGKIISNDNRGHLLEQKSEPLNTIRIVTNDVENPLISRVVKSAIDSPKECIPPENSSSCITLEGRTEQRNDKDNSPTKYNVSKETTILSPRSLVISLQKCDYSRVQLPISPPSTTKQINTRSRSRFTEEQFSRPVSEDENNSKKCIDVSNMETGKTTEDVPPNLRKRLKRDSTMILNDDLGVPCKRILRSSAMRQSRSEENNIVTLNTSNSVINKGTKHGNENNNTINIEPPSSKNVLNYSDLDLFCNENNESQTHIKNDSNAKNENSEENPVFCVMLQKYGRHATNNFSKKLPDSVVNSTKTMLQDKISAILDMSPNDAKNAMNELVDIILSWDLKRFICGLMAYFKDPQRKIELFNKISAPPAPPMTKSEQILLYVITQLRICRPSIDILNQIFGNIEYVLFQLSRTPEFDVIECMSHFYAILCRYFKMKSRLRLFMLDAMYCIQYKAVALIKQCLDVWMHVLPLAHMGIAKSPLVTCLVYLLHFYKCEDRYNRVQDIRNILSRKYFYKITEWNEPKILEMFRNAITDIRAIPVEAKLLKLALIIVSKRHGAKWCQNNIIKKMLLPMIEKNISERAKIFCISMLGPLLKPYPVDMKVHCEIVFNQLLDLLKQNPSHKIQEAIISSLIYMSKHNLNRVLQTLIVWKPQRISSELESVFHDFVSEKPLKVWKSVLTKIQLAQ